MLWEGKTYKRELEIYLKNVWRKKTPWKTDQLDIDFMVSYYLVYETK